MLEEWTADVVGRMHRAKITGLQLAERAGITNAYLSTVLNGHKGTDETKQRIIVALESLEAEAGITQGADHDTGGD